MKDKLLEIISDPNGKLIAVDLDGTLSTGEAWGLVDEIEPAPIVKVIKLVNSLYMKGGHIIIYTARRPEMYRQTHAWLMKHGVYFHGIIMQGKPGANCYIDDKCLNVEDLSPYY